MTGNDRRSVTLDFATRLAKLSEQKDIARDITSVLMGRPKEVTDEQILVAARRCFLKRGATISAVEIAGELGVSHTTLFNRFGSKEALLLAALGPPKEINWVTALDAGPDTRPIREQLIEHGKVMAIYFQDLQAGLGVLQAAGIDPRKAYRERKGTPAPELASRALVGWLKRAQQKGRIAKCDIDALASTILGALHGWALATRVCGGSTNAAASDRFVESFVQLLWSGIGVEKG